MDATFALPKLPGKVRRKVVQVMDTHGILGFSLISKECKQLAISSGIKGGSMSVRIGDEITISYRTTRGFINLYFYTEPHLNYIMGTDGQKKTLEPPESVVVDLLDLNRDDLKWKNKKDFGMKEWLEHINTVFDCRLNDSVIFQQNAFRFDIDYVKETFRSTDFLTVRHSGNFEYNESILRKYLQTEMILIEADAFPGSRIPSKYLIQNFEMLSIEYENDGLRCVSLDDLLIINSASIQITTYQAPLEMLNKFVKLWKKGASPRMKSFQIIYHNGSETDINEILDGIKYEEVGRERPRPNMLTDRGFNTCRMDGTKAAIRFEYLDRLAGMTRFSMFL